MSTQQTTFTEFKSELFAEARVSLGLILPLAIVQIAQTTIPVVSSVMMGLLGTQNLAAGALGAIAYITLESISVAILSAGGALAAEAFGANNLDKVSRIASQGLWLVAAISLPAMLILWSFDSILIFFGQQESNILLTKSYLHVMVWGLPPAIGFLYLRQIAAAINFSQFGLVNIFISLILIVPTNYLLMFGYLGFPALGLAGIGWGNTLIFWINFLASVSVIYSHPKSRDYRLFQHLLQFDKKLFLQIFLAGWPTGIQTGIEQGLYMITAILVGSIDTASLAGHEIAIQTAEFFLTIPVAISHATTARIGLRLGENNIIGAMRAFVVNLTFGILFAVVVAIGFDCFTLNIVSIYLDINDPDNAAAIGWSTSFLFLAGISQIFYSIQFITIGALIGLQDTLIPMLITLISFWGLGLGGGYLMAITWGWGGIGFWYGLILAPAVSGIIFIVRFYKKSVEQFSQIQI